MYAAGAWSSKYSYTEDDISAICHFDALLHRVNLRRCITEDLHSQLDAIAGDFLFVSYCLCDSISNARQTNSGSSPVVNFSAIRNIEVAVSLSSAVDLAGFCVILLCVYHDHYDIYLNFAFIFVF